jgi:hypothetical protein
MTDHRRYGVIETRFRRHGEIACYWLTIDGDAAPPTWKTSQRPFMSHCSPLRI